MRTRTQQDDGRSTDKIKALVLACRVRCVVLCPRLHERSTLTVRHASRSMFYHSFDFFFPTTFPGIPEEPNKQRMMFASRAGSSAEQPSDPKCTSILARTLYRRRECLGVASQNGGARAAGSRCDPI